MTTVEKRALRLLDKFLTAFPQSGPDHLDRDVFHEELCSVARETETLFAELGMLR